MFRTSSPAVARRSIWPTLAAAALALALVLVGPFPVGAQAQAETASPLHTVSVSGVGQAEVKPDEAVIQLGVTARGDTAQRASRKATASMDAIIASLQDSGVVEADIRTTRLELHQTRRRDKETREVTVGWQVRNRVKATIRDIDTTGDVIDTAIASGATNLDRLQFRASDPSEALAKAREEAVAAASLSASQLASAVGVEVAGVLSIVEGGGNGGFDTSGGKRLFRAAGPEALATPIQPGMIDVQVTVYIDYLIS